MHNLVFDGMDSAYHALFEDVRLHGRPFGPRGKACVEVRPATFELTAPEYGVYTGASRRLNYRFMAVETLLYLAGVGGATHARLILDANPAMAFAVNPATGHFDGAYGPALGEALPAVHDLLLRDNDTRQAVASIWNPDMLTRLAGSKDVPCTCLLHFFYEYTKMDNTPMLSLHVYMRSNDLNWGMPYDVAAFTTIQMAMAAGLNVECGRYYHTAGSLHYYEEHEANTDGERPPTLRPVTNEDWLQELPSPPVGGCGIRVVVDQALTVCQELLGHRGRSLLWKDFKPSFDTCGVVGYLLELMKFRHPRQRQQVAKWKDTEVGD